MAEQEVVKHTKKVYKIWNSKEHSVIHKIREFFLEIIIIVFAVNLSIWLHELSEQNHQRKEAKDFLNGLKEDLLGDIQEMKLDKNSYVNQGNSFKYITTIKPNQTLQIDSLKKHQNFISRITRLQQNNGRFEGFKSSGKIGTIEDKKLQNNIMDLYQENIPSLLAITDFYISFKIKLVDFRMRNLKRDIDSTTNIDKILLFDEAQNISAALANTNEIIHQYDVCIEKMQNIVLQIENNNNE
ncbi:MAG: hypothetical protein ABWY22_13495 [Flavobacterium sp.]